MSGEKQDVSGPFEGLANMLRELIRSPVFKRSVGILFGNLDPENARLLVRTLMWEDPEFFLGLMGAAPRLVDALVIGFDELAEGLSKFTPKTLSGFLQGLLEEIEFERLGEVCGKVFALLFSVSGKEQAQAPDAGKIHMSSFISGIRRGLGEKKVSPEDFSGLVAERIAEKVSGAVDAVEEKLASGEESYVICVEKVVNGLKESLGRSPAVSERLLKPVAEMLVSILKNGQGDLEKKGGSDA